jgi:uncharacterized membrane protein
MRAGIGTSGRYPGGAVGIHDARAGPSRGTAPTSVRLPCMLNGLRTRWRDLIEGFWFVPGLLSVAFFGLAVLVLWIDRSGVLGDAAVTFGGDPPAARSILTTIAGSLITVAGLTFSITIVTLQLVSSQFTPRVIRTLLADRLTQIVMGSFVGIFTYCLVVLRAIRQETDPGEFEFVPALGVTLSIVLAVAALGLLIAFIHHTAVSIQVSSITARVARETLAAAGRLYPERYGTPEEPEQADELLDSWRSEEGIAIRPTRPGFVQRISLDRLVEEIAGRAERFHVAVRPGDFVTEETETLVVWSPHEIDEELQESLRDLVYVADERDVDQDVAFGVRQLTDVALRAVSPGINDPTTALTCIGYLAAIFERLAERKFPLRVRRFEDESLVGIVERWEFAELIGALREIATVTRDDPRVTKALLAASGRIARNAGPDRRSDVAALVDAIAEPALEQLGSKADRTDVEEALERVRALGAHEG